MNQAIQIVSLLPAIRQGKAMKRNPLVVCLLIICITILAFTLLTRQTLYESAVPGR